MTADELAVQQAVSNKLSEAMLAGDMEAVGSCFSEDAVLLPQDAPMAEGRDAIVEVFAALPPLSSISSAVHEGVIYGDTAVVRGSVTLVMQVPKVGDVESTAKFVEVREKQDDGSWVLIRDIFNFDAPLGG
jgi:uncharacterized protein (TIGR02246 family)